MHRVPSVSRNEFMKAAASFVASELVMEPGINKRISRRAGRGRGGIGILERSMPPSRDRMFNDDPNVDQAVAKNTGR